MQINPEVDLTIDIHNLTSEFQRLALVLFQYYKYKAQVEEKRDIAKAKLKEVRAIAYKRIRSDMSRKHTENSTEADIDTDPDVLAAQSVFFSAEHDATTWSGAVDSMKAKKDSLIQLGADSRKERQ